MYDVQRVHVRVCVGVYVTFVRIYVTACSLEDTDTVVRSKSDAPENKSLPKTSIKKWIVEFTKTLIGNVIAGKNDDSFKSKFEILNKLKMKLQCFSKSREYKLEIQIP